jgi:hypothetical protein
LIDSTNAQWQAENTSTTKDAFPVSLQAGVQVKIPSKAVIVLGKEID